MHQTEPTRESENSVTSDEPRYFAHESAYVDDGARVGDGTRIWHFAHVMSGAVLGENCNLGQNVHIAGDVALGRNVKVQNNVSIYTGTIIEDDVFLGPSCVFTNVTNPRSQVARQALYERTLVRRGVTVGANATVVCGIEIGRHAFVAAGAVVTRNVPDYALMVGTPARQDGWMSRHGHRLLDPTEEGIMQCPESGLRYQESEPGVLRCLDLDEDSPLPAELAVGTIAHEEFKRRREDS
jgi:UDP-2-acetamido-3-amino-2,3-dideoxy-glucuronate N-acetyltransferase